jgi:TetR/AcrR family acrAB operon transcriptional repressor
MVRRTKEEALQTRSQILEAAEKAFYERGISRTTLAEIAGIAGVTRGAIYWHFKDKADLFCEMVARVTMPMEDAPCQITPANDADPLASVRTMLVGILQRTSGDAQARRVFHIVFNKCEYVDEMQPVWQRFREMQAGCLARLEQGLVAAMARGQLPAQLDARRTATGLHALINGLISKWVMDPEAMPAQREAAQIIDVFLQGIRAAPAQPGTAVHPARRAQRMKTGAARKPGQASKTVVRRKAAR